MRRSLWTGSLIVVAVLTGCGTLPSDSGAAPPTTGLASGWAEGVGAQAGLRPVSGGTTTLTWSDCSEEMLDGFECGSLSVPVDWATRGKGPRITLAVARHRATGGNRIGSLFFNPGGPGASGVSSLPMIWSLLPAAVQERFDLVAWDPRGVGRSAPLTRCERPTVTLPATGRVDWARFVREARNATRTANKECARRYPVTFGNLGTEQVVRDLDALRAAVGDAQLTYWAMSYGTRIGYDYALQFPVHLRAMILDGSVNPNSSIVDLASSEVNGDTAIGYLFEAYPETGAQWRVVRSELDRRAIPVAAGRWATRWNLSRFLDEYAGAEVSYPAIARVIGFAHDALFGTPEQVAAARTALAGLPLDDAIELAEPLFAAVNCADYADRPSDREQAELAQRLRAQAPLGGWLGPVADITMCEGIRARPRPVPVDFGVNATVPVLMLGATRDQHTPYAWTADMARAFQAGRVVTYVGAKHVVFGAGRSACVDDVASRYLLSLALPPMDIACPGEVVPG